MLLIFHTPLQEKQPPTGYRREALDKLSGSPTTLKSEDVSPAEFVGTRHGEKSFALHDRVPRLQRGEGPNRNRSHSGFHLHAKTPFRLENCGRGSGREWKKENVMRLGQK